MQDPTLYNAYTSFLTTQRTTKGHAWQPSYNKFYHCMRTNADLLDAADKAKATSTIRTNSSQLCLYNTNVSNNDDKDDDDDDYNNLLAFAAQLDGRALQAYLAQRGPCPRRYPPANKHALRNVRFPEDLRRELPSEFLPELNALPISIQHRICSLFSTNKAVKNAELVVRHRDFVSEQPSFDDDTVYLSSNSVQHIDSFDDSFDDYSCDNFNDNSTTTLAVNRLDNQRPLKRASGNKIHKRNHLVKQKTKELPNYSSLKPGDPIKLLPNEKCYIVRENGERICVLNYALLPKHLTNKNNSEA